MEVGLLFCSLSDFYLNMADYILFHLVIKCQQNRNGCSWLTLLCLLVTLDSLQASY